MALDYLWIRPISPRYGYLFNVEIRYLMLSSFNRWFDGLNDTHRELSFIALIGGTLLPSLIALYCYDCYWPFPLWALSWLFVRLYKR